MTSEHKEYIQNNVSSTDLLPSTRALIVKTGILLQGIKISENQLPITANPKIKYVYIQAAIELQHDEPQHNLLGIRSIKTWWDRRYDFYETASINHRKRSGRPQHKSFTTRNKKDGVVDYCLGLPMGYHQKDVCDYFEIGCTKTLRKYTNKDISWVYSPKEHWNDDLDVKRKRINYANWCLTPSGKLRKKVRNATFIDHKRCCFYGINKRHSMQAKKRGADYMELEKQNYDLYNPSILVYFACNINGTSLYIHGNKKRRKKSNRHFIKSWTIDQDVLEAFEEKFMDFMKKFQSDYIIADGARIQHTQQIVDYLQDNHIAIHPSACKPHNILNGYPPYSHTCMPLDFRAFAPLQQELSWKCKNEYQEYYEETGNDKTCFIYDHVSSIWETEKYHELCRNAIMSYGDTIQQIINYEGDISSIR